MLAAAGWCPACQHFQPAYERVAVFFASGPGTAARVATLRVDCADSLRLCADFDIGSYPSLRLGAPDLFLDKALKALKSFPHDGSRDAAGVVRAHATISTRLCFSALCCGRALPCARVHRASNALGSLCYACVSRRLHFLASFRKPTSVIISTRCAGWSESWASQIWSTGNPRSTRSTPL